MIDSSCGEGLRRALKCDQFGSFDVEFEEADFLQRIFIHEVIDRSDRDRVGGAVLRLIDRSETPVAVAENSRSFVESVLAGDIGHRRVDKPQIWDRVNIIVPTQLLDAFSRRFEGDDQSLAANLLQKVAGDESDVHGRFDDGIVCADVEPDLVGEVRLIESVVHKNAR